MQEGSLCAQHCLNALLQGPYFSAVDLADIARQLDETERQQMAEAGTETEGYQHFIKQPSNNYDDSGFFSVQVIDKALRVMGLELVSYTSQRPIAQQARTNPMQMKSYICNFGEHWLTVRKIGNQWFNLNSLLTGPELISDTYLSMFLTQLQQDGYSIFIVMGELSECEADQLLRLCPAVQPIKPQLITDNAQSRAGKGGASAGASGGEQDAEVEKALDESKKMIESDDVSLQRALQMSMEGYIEESVSRIETACATGETSSEQSTSSGQNIPSVGQSTSTSQNIPSSNLEKSTQGESTPGYKLGGTTSQSHDEEEGEKLDADEMRQKRLAFLSRFDNQKDSVEQKEQTNTKGTCSCDNTTEAAVNGTNSETRVSELSEEEMLQQAIAMSMSQDT
ncbi:ataxin-3-like isoform X2 [Mercenaria mercenaria]|uniref:ataxin-3-like isoform X2 n=1 Tax=Mercenaria mercenaria TaxID=6596 RepID=UPI00234EA544|nr:ataxin-3-like isoform X2 [Mercenaria mercenaria]